MRYNRFGFMSNKFNSGNLTPFPSPNLNVSQTTNSTAVTYTITSDITHLSNLAYTMTGTAVANDFSDSALSGNIVLTGGNATLIKQIVIGNSTDPSFAVQLRDTANGSIFYEGNTFQVTTLGEPVFEQRTNTNLFLTSAQVGTGSYNGANVTVTRILPIGWPGSEIQTGNIFPYTGIVRFTNLGTTGGNMDVLLVASGAGAGSRFDTSYSDTDWKTSGGGGGGEHVVTTISIDSLQLNTDYVYSIGYRGKGGLTGPENIGFLNGQNGNNTSMFSITVAGGTGGKGDQLASGNSAGIGGSTTHVSGGNGGDGNTIGGAGQDGQVGTSVPSWMAFPGNTTIANVIIGGGGGGANAAVGAAPSVQTPQFGLFGVGGSAIGKAGDLGNTFFTSTGLQSSPHNFTNENKGTGDDGTIQFRWPTQVNSRTIAIS